MVNTGGNRCKYVKYGWSPGGHRGSPGGHADVCSLEDNQPVMVTPSFSVSTCTGGCEESDAQRTITANNKEHP